MQIDKCQYNRVALTLKRTISGSLLREIELHLKPGDQKVPKLLQLSHLTGTDQMLAVLCEHCSGVK